MYKNSYIFLNKGTYNNKPKTDENKLTIYINNSFKNFLNSISSDFKFILNSDIKDNKVIYEIRKGEFNISIDQKKYKVTFEYKEVNNNYYLTLFMSEYSSKEIYEVFKKINGLINDTNSSLANEYVSIITYDCVSEYYCNKLFTKLNKFERTFRKLLYNIYSLNYNLNYYESITSKSDNLKETVQITGKKIIKENKLTDDAKLKLFFYCFEYKNYNDLLFKKDVSAEEKSKIDDLINNPEKLKNKNEFEIQKLLKIASEKSDFERYFQNKQLGEDFETCFRKINDFRNTIAHCRNINFEEFEKCNNLFNETNKLLNKAIKISESYDFTLNTISQFEKSIDNMQKKISQFVSLFAKNVIANFSSLADTISSVNDSLLISYFKNPKFQALIDEDEKNENE